MSEAGNKIRGIKAEPSIMSCTYSEAVYKLAPDYIEQHTATRRHIARAVAMIYGRDLKQVTDDLFNSAQWKTR